MTDPAGTEIWQAGRDAARDERDAAVEALAELTGRHERAERHLAYLLTRSLAEWLLFDRHGTPVAWVRRLVCRCNGRVRRGFRSFVFGRDGQPRPAWRLWLESPAYRALPRAHRPPTRGPATGLAHNIAPSLASGLDPRPAPVPGDGAMACGFTQRRLLVDISALSRTDYITGIQRVARSILRVWLDTPPPGWAVVPIRADHDGGYVHARQWTADFHGASAAGPDTPVEPASGDLFLGLDLALKTTVANRGLLDDWARRGVAVHFVVYDLLPVLMPQHFAPALVAQYRQWLDVVLRHDGAACISHTVASELAALAARDGSGAAPAIRAFRLGTDIAAAAMPRILPEGAAALLAAMRRGPSFLMVGTVEPRKGHALALDAFEQLWQQPGADALETGAMLVIVGRQGWMVDALCERLRTHPEAGRRLHWIANADDGYLARLYRAAGCLLAASEGEGYGLPLIEAAQHGLPVLARDIAVFREVAGAHAAYFPDSHADRPAAGALADAVRIWLRQRAAGTHPVSSGMAMASWPESAASLLDALSSATAVGPAVADRDTVA